MSIVFATLALLRLASIVQVSGALTKDGINIVLDSLNKHSIEMFTARSTKLGQDYT